MMKKNFSSCKQILQQGKKNKTHTFYKADQIRFRSLLNLRTVKPSKPQYIVPNNPWTTLSHEQIDSLVERLDDQPQQLMQALRSRKTNKFTLLKRDEQKENTGLLQKIQAKRKMYEDEFRNLLKHPNKSSLNILLPKLEGIRYTYKDTLHKLDTTISVSHK